MKKLLCTFRTMTRFGAMRFLLLSAVLASVAGKAQTPLDLRVALVIGNAAYAGPAVLANPVNDSQAMAKTLRKLGFTVIEVRDGDKAEITDAVMLVSKALQGRQGIGMLYYAGHGIQQDWRNYMVPVDAKLTKPEDVITQTVDVNSVIDAFKTAGTRMNIMVLDACRDNPFANGTTLGGKGLAQLDAPPGTFLAYATAPGNVASDGSDDDDGKNGNGLYTKYLLQELQKPVAKIEDVFKRVRFNVRQKSNGRQIPWESTSLEEDFYFNLGQPASAQRPIENDHGKLFATEKIDWDKIKNSSSADDFYAFLQKYPTGLIAEAAQYKLDSLSKALVLPQVAGDGGSKQVISVDPADRFRLNDKYFIVRRDGYTQLETSRFDETVTSVGRDSIEINHGKHKLTNSGGMLARTQSGIKISFDPPLMLLPSGDFQIGKKWLTQAEISLPFGLKGWGRYEVKVVAQETVETSAGQFKTYKVEVTGSTFQGNTIAITYWADPAYGYPVRIKWLERSGPRITVNYVQEWYKAPERVGT